ncbi:hypothetical protein ACYSNO_10445 [Enterococcus sp. LJL98]
MKKLSVLLLFGLLLFSACRPKDTPPVTSSSSENTSSSLVNESTSESKTETSTEQTSKPSESHSEAPIPIDTQRNLVGTWTQENQRLIVYPNGDWELSGKINSTGTLTVAADFDQTKMIKLDGFNQNIDGIGTYFIVHFNPDSTKIGFGYLGQFTRSGEQKETLSDKLFQPNYQQTAIDFNQNILGTWTIKEGTEFHNTWNYNPDGTFEMYSEGRGSATRGTYKVKKLKNNWIDVTYTYDETGESSTHAYLIKDGLMTENHFEEIKMVRNLVPAFPNP